MHEINCFNNMETGIELNALINPISDRSNENEINSNNNIIVFKHNNASQHELDINDYSKQMIVCDNQTIFNVNGLKQQNKCREQEEMINVCHNTNNTNKEALVPQLLYKIDPIYQIINENFDNTNNELFEDYGNIDGNDDTTDHTSDRLQTINTKPILNSLMRLKSNQHFQSDLNYYYNNSNEFCNNSLESFPNKTIVVDCCLLGVSEANVEINLMDSDVNVNTNQLKTICDFDSQIDSHLLALNQVLLPEINYQNDQINNQNNGVYLNTLINPICDENELNESSNIILYNPNNNSSDYECIDYYSSKEKIAQQCKHENQFNVKSNGIMRLKNKLKRIKSGSKTWYKCGFGGCSFGSLYSGVVERHKTEKHNGCGQTEESKTIVNRFDCDWPNCGASLVTYHKLVEHMRKHTGEKPFKCKRFGCNYATGRKYSMRIHDRTHMIKDN